METGGNFMPQQDRHKERLIPIEFDFYDLLETLPKKNRCSIVLVTCGSATIKINGQIHLLQSPCVLCLSQYDTVECIHADHLSAKSFHFDPWFIKACLCFDNLNDAVTLEPQYAYDRQNLYLFTKHHDHFQGIFSLTPQSYLHINEQMLMIGAETFSQSDGFWTCRIRRMLRQLIRCISDIYADQRKLGLFEALDSHNPASICAQYIHGHYAEAVSLGGLCSLVNLNRTSLNQQFKAHFGCTCMEYLLNYRLKIAQELLSNTNMKISEIAQNCGFKYETYFIRQFTAKLGISPAAYQKNPLSYSAYDGRPVRKL